MVKSPNCFDSLPMHSDMAQYEISSSDEELPFACYICREQFTNAVVTKWVLWWVRGYY